MTIMAPMEEKVGLTEIAKGKTNAMTMTLETRLNRSIAWRILTWGGIAVLLTLPLLLGFPWTLFDFVAAAVLLSVAGLMLELALRLSGDWAYRLGAGIAIGAGLLLLWVNGAVGFLGNEDNPANLMFFAVHLMAMVFAVRGRFEAAGMASAMWAAAATQLLVGLIGYFGGFASPGEDGIFEVVFGTTLFEMLWLSAAGLFARAARRASDRMPDARETK